MKKWASILLLAAISVRGAAADSLPSLFRVRTGADTQGVVHQLGQSSGTTAIVLVFLGMECPISQRYVPELNRIAAARATNSIEFYGIVSGRRITRAQAKAFVEEYAIQFPVLVDDGLLLARWLRPTHVPQAFVLKRDGDVVYRGRIDEAYEAIGKPRTVVRHRELRDAITAVTAGRMPPRVFARPVGCYFEELPPR